MIKTAASQPDPSVSARADTYPTYLRAASIAQGAPTNADRPALKPSIRRLDAVTMIAARDTANTRLALLETRTRGIDNIVSGAMESISEAAGTSASKPADSILDKLIIPPVTWRKYLDPGYKSDAKRSKKFHQALEVVRVHMKGQVIGVVNRSQLSLVEEKQYKAALDLLSREARKDADKGEVPWRLQDKSLVPPNPSWHSELPSDLVDSLRLHLDGNYSLEKLSREHSDAYYAAQKRYSMRKYRAAKSTGPLETPSTNGITASLVLPRGSSPPSHHASSAAVSAPDGSASPSTSPRTLKRMRSFNLNELWSEPDYTPERLG